MAELLRDREMRKILNTVIENGDEESVRPNAYVLRLGADGEYLTTGKSFTLGEQAGDKKGIRVPPGQSVALTAFETIDFRRETVDEHFPDCDLHGLISPTTDLQREGVSAPSTHIDAGYHGTLNWTIRNSSSEERRFVFRERMFRLVIFKLAKGERPDDVYKGAYQDKLGYVRSKRAGAPTGMRDVDWEDSTTTEGPEVLLERLVKSGFPWSTLGTRLKVIGDELQSVTHEYSQIHDSIERLEREVGEVKASQSDLSDRIRTVLREELAQGAVSDQIRNVVRDEHYRWLGGAFTALVGLLATFFSIMQSEFVVGLLDLHGNWIGPGVAVAAFAAMWLLIGRRQ